MTACQRKPGCAGHSTERLRTEDDGLSRTAWHAVSVDDHTCHVVKRVSRFVRTLDLPRAISRDLELAAFLHDAGKADRRFQGPAVRHGSLERARRPRHGQERAVVFDGRLGARRPPAGVAP